MTGKPKRGLLRLYVWDDVYCDYTCGMAFAVAHNVDEAREIIIAATTQWLWNKKAKTANPYRITAAEWEATTANNLDCHLDNKLSQLGAEPDVYDLKSPVGYAVYGGG